MPPKRILIDGVSTAVVVSDRTRSAGAVQRSSAVSVRRPALTLGRRLGLGQTVHEFFPQPKPLGPIFHVFLVQPLSLAKHNGDDILKIPRTSGFEFEDDEILRSDHPHRLVLDAFAPASLQGLLIVRIARREQIHRKQSLPIPHAPFPKRRVSVAPLRIPNKSPTPELVIQGCPLPLVRKDQAINVLCSPACAPDTQSYRSNQTILDTTFFKTAQEGKKSFGKRRFPRARHGVGLSGNPKAHALPNLFELIEVLTDAPLNVLARGAGEIRSHGGQELTPAPIGEAQRQREAGRWRNSLLPHGIDSTESRGIGQGNRTILTARLRKPLGSEYYFQADGAQRDDNRAKAITDGVARGTWRSVNPHDS